MKKSAPIHQTANFSFVFLRDIKEIHGRDKYFAFIEWLDHQTCPLLPKELIPDEYKGFSAACYAHDYFSYFDN